MGQGQLGSRARGSGVRGSGGGGRRAPESISILEWQGLVGSGAKIGYISHDVIPKR
jgi:hypothetical protein